MQVPGPGGAHILKREYILSASSYTFSLGRIGVDLVVILRGKSTRFPYDFPFLRLLHAINLSFSLDGEKQVKYASELF